MREAKRKRLEKAGWRVGSVAEFLDLSPEEAAFVELKVALAEFLREFRRKRRWTQTQVAKRLGSSQSRVAKMEAADPSVSMDLLVRSLLILGASRREVGRVIATPPDSGRSRGPVGRRYTGVPAAMERPRPR